MSTYSLRPSGPRRRGGRWLTKPVAAVVVALLTIGAAGAMIASAAVPEFPNNIVVFPNRDFVSVEGYASHAGETATVEITRDGAVIGVGQGHRVGWRRGLRGQPPRWRLLGRWHHVNVTPDIVAGDVVSITFPDGPRTPHHLHGRPPPRT